ncbi:MAG: hypothetical protein IJQ11_04435, partial [Bacteroidales bacterium]|nr:hypothetical protein [Bacteroidales bacterium]
MAKVVKKHNKRNVLPKKSRLCLSFWQDIFFIILIINTIILWFVYHYCVIQKQAKKAHPFRGRSFARFLFRNTDPTDLTEIHPCYPCSMIIRVSGLHHPIHSAA